MYTKEEALDVVKKFQKEGVISLDNDKVTIWEKKLEWTEPSKIPNLQLNLKLEELKEILGDDGTLKFHCKISIKFDNQKVLIEKDYRMRKKKTTIIDSSKIEDMKVYLKEKCKIEYNIEPMEGREKDDYYNIRFVKLNIYTVSWKGIVVMEPITNEFVFYDLITDRFVLNGKLCKNIIPSIYTYDYMILELGDGNYIVDLKNNQIISKIPSNVIDVAPNGKNEFYLKVKRNENNYFGLFDIANQQWLEQPLYIEKELQNVQKTKKYSKPKYIGSRFFLEEGVVDLYAGSAFSNFNSLNRFSLVYPIKREGSILNQNTIPCELIVGYNNNFLALKIFDFSKELYQNCLEGEIQDEKIRKIVLENKEKWILINPKGNLLSEKTFINYYGYKNGFVLVNYRDFLEIIDIETEKGILLSNGIFLEVKE